LSADAPVIRTRKLRDLEVSAASGLVADAGAFYVVADDELDLHVYPRREPGPVRRIPLRSGAPSAGPPQARPGAPASFSAAGEKLPAEPAARKRAKPDFECLLWLDASRLLTLGSGSTPGRCRAAILSLATGEVRPVDLAPLYHALGAEIPELNIEGAVLAGDTLHLLQRGNGAAGDNALVALDPAAFLRALEAGTPPPACVRSIQRVALGELGGQRLSFTDAAATPRGDLLFAAAAEASPDTYRDGPCTGSVIGELTREGILTWMAPVDRTVKIEGIHLEGRELYLVADADDPTQPAPLYAATLEPPQRG
jgi:hypothetical protein